MEFICAYLTGKFTKEDFVSEYKKAVMDTPNAYLHEAESFSQFVEDILLCQGIKLTAYAQEEDFSAQMRLKLHNLSKTDCTTKLIDALIDVSYSQKDKDILRQYNFSSFPNHKINSGKPALRALNTLYKGAEFEWGKDIIENKLGKNTYTPNCLPEGFREDIARWMRLNEEQRKNAAVFNKNMTQIYD